MKEIISLLKKHESWRNKCLNLIASENILSQRAKRVYCSDLMYRYAEGLPFKRYYQGTKYFDQIEEKVSKAFLDHFRCSFVDLRPISGTLANLAVFSALKNKNNRVITLGMTGGSHISHEKRGALGFLGFKIFHFDLKRNGLFIDLQKAKEKILKIKPRFIVLGGTVILFPQPIKELKDVCEKTNTLIVYDGAHVFGLISAGFFQDPLKEGADILTASTHKTFPGPQGGIILANIGEQLKKKIQQSVFPGITSNHHLHRIPVLGVVLDEMKKFGRDYGLQIIKNAQALAQFLYNYGFNVLGKDYGFTKSHQVLVNVEKWGGGKRVAEVLERANIIVNKNVLLGGQLDVKNPQGIRLGVQEVTRLGMKEKEMEKIAFFIKAIIIDKKNITKIKKEVIALRKRFQKLRYG